MKRFMSQKSSVVCMVIMSVFVSILSGCGGGGGGSWTEPGTPGGPSGTTARPTVTSSVPVLATPISVVQPDSAVTVTFNKDMAPGSITSAGTFTVSGPGSTPVQGAAIPVTYDVPSRTATFHPLAALAPGTYIATIKGTGTNAATDTAVPGNALAGVSASPTVANDYVWSFTTSLAAPAARPVVSATLPITTPSGITPNVATGTLITATFNKVMNAATITATGAFTITGPGVTPVQGAAIPVTYDIPSRTATFHPLAPLTAGVTYVATIKGIGANPVTDSAVPANALAGDPTQPTVAHDYVWSFTTGFVTPPGNINDLMSYGVASAGGITNTGATKINGNVVLDPLDSCNNVPVGATDNFGLCAGTPPTNNTGDKVITQSFPDTTTADAIRVQLLAKWNNISPSGTPLATVLGCGVIGNAGGGGAGIGCSGNPTLLPGNYISATGSTINISGDLTLDAGGNSNAVWIIQAPSALTSEVGGKIILANGAKASNVWWFVGSSADLKTNSIFNGNVLASAAISMGTGSTSCGRLFSGAEGFGAFTFLGNMVSVPGHPNAPLGCL